MQLQQGAPDDQSMDSNSVKHKRTLVVHHIDVQPFQPQNIGLPASQIELVKLKS